MDWGKIEAIPSPLPVDEAAGNLKKCVVGLQEEWEETKTIIGTWFPWLTIEDTVKANTGMGSRAETRDTIRKDLLRDFLSFNECDMSLWEVAQERFAEQAEFARAQKIVVR